MISILIVLVVVGFCLWLITTYVPMAPPVKSILVAVTCLVLVLWLLEAFGIVNLPPIRTR